MKKLFLVEFAQETTDTNKCFNTRIVWAADEAEDLIVDCFEKDECVVQIWAVHEVIGTPNV